MDFIESVFGAGGLLAQRFSGYEPRRGQIELARAVHQAILTGRNVLAEAPTGTGKSIGYSVPAAWWAARENRERDAAGQQRARCVIVTANIALQEQLLRKDLPLLASLLPWQFSFALAKGRGNYLCLDRFDDNVANLVLEPLIDPTDRQQWERIAEWATATEEGDLSELPFEPGSRVRSLFTTSADDCTGKACPRYKDCHAEKARQKLQNADVIVTNYHLFFSHLAVVASSGGTAGILPEYEAVIFDEGHKAADIARDFFGFRITPYSVRYAARLLAPSGNARGKKQEVMLDPLLKERIGKLADDFFGALRVYMHGDDYTSRLTEKDPVRSSELVEALSEAAKLYQRASEETHYTADRRQDLRNAAARAEVMVGNIRAAMACDSERVVFFLEEDAHERVSLCAKPIDVADMLRGVLFEAEKVRAVAVTSATLVSAGSFDYVASELGAEDADELVAESPFEWSKQALLFIPTNMPMPNDNARFPAAVAEKVVDVVTAAEGRTLGLFTSYRMLEAAHRALMVSGWRGRVLRQGTAPRTQLIRQFQEDVGSVLLGTESFWAGVDVPGESLSCVVIDRLPFPSPDDPILSALEAREGSRVFKSYSMPRAIIAFRQGFGRLIRTVTDRGVVVVLDRRIVDKPYGRAFLKALPSGVGLSRNMDHLATFIAGKGPHLGAGERSEARARAASAARR